MLVHNCALGIGKSLSKKLAQQIHKRLTKLGYDSADNLSFFSSLIKIVTGKKKFHPPKFKQISKDVGDLIEEAKNLGIDSKEEIELITQKASKIWNSPNDYNPGEVPKAKEIVEKHVAQRGKSVNRLKPDPKATGDHTTFKYQKNGAEKEGDLILSYETYTENPRNPTGFDTVKRYDIGSHIDKKTELAVKPHHVHDFKNKQVRYPFEEEIPNANKHLRSDQ